MARDAPCAACLPTRRVGFSLLLLYACAMTLAIILGNTGSVVWMPAVLPVLYWYMVCRPLSMTPLLRAARSGDLEDLRKQFPDPAAPARHQFGH